MHAWFYNQIYVVTEIDFKCLGRDGITAVIFLPLGVWVNT
jgi:hypothetical protein